MRLLKYNIRLLFIALLLSTNSIAQEFNYRSINIQGQLVSSDYDAADFEFLVVSFAGDTLWRETHDAVNLTVQGAFELSFGNGIFITGESTEFYELNWEQVEQIELYNVTEARYLYGAFNVQSVPYAMHSLHLLSPISLVGLEDLESEGIVIGNVIRYNGDTFEGTTVLIGDTAVFSNHSDSTFFTDTVWFAFNNNTADSALFSYWIDSSFYAPLIENVSYVDTIQMVDSTDFVTKAINNWGILGDEEREAGDFIGTIEEESFELKTNSNSRLSFNTDGAVSNTAVGTGFSLSTKNGVLFTPNATESIDIIDGSYFYYSGAEKSVHGGTNDGTLDTLKGAYSFTWGENVGTNGTYGTIFGKNNYGDSAFIGSALTPYQAISGFAMGKDCNVTRMGVAIGDNATADFYRSVAIGKDVTSTKTSAGLAMGNNVLVEGATSWAVGHNLQVPFHFCTALGSNASTGTGVLGSFVYGDISTVDTITNTASNQFMVRADGGYVFYTDVNTTMGVELLPGAGSWSMVSDRNKKRNIKQLNPSFYRNNFNDIDVFSWNYIGNETAHFGAMAQDFYETFNVGEKPLYINMIDSDGVAFLGIKMIYETLKELPTKKEVKQIELEISEEKAKLDILERRINELYEELGNN